MMNLGHLDIHSVHHKRPSIERTATQQSFTASKEDLRHNDSEGDYASEGSSEDTIVRWHSPTEYPSQSNENLHSEATVDAITKPPRPYVIPELARLQPAAMRRISEVRRMDPYDSPPSPNIDDTPYIRYALDQLTRDDEVGAQRPSNSTTSSYPVDRIIPDHGLGYVQSIKKVKPPAVVEIPSLWRNNTLVDTGAHAPRGSAERDSTASTAKPDMYIPIPAPKNSPRYPDLTYKPMILRPFSMIMLLTLCLLMIAALMFCAIYSTTNNGFTNYSGGIYNGLYFVFAFLPQLLAAVILLYVQSVMAGLTRIMPFAMMASFKPQGRANALFTRLYQSHWLPRFDLLRNGEMVIGISTFLLWPILFTIPLQSALFSVVPSDGKFRWTAVQGVAWTLVVLYISAAIGLLMIIITLWHRTTGLIWDPRSLADIISLLPRSNSLGDFQDTEVLSTLDELRNALPDRCDRLGYWRSTAPNTNTEMFHAIGEEGSTTRRYTLQSGKAIPSLEKTSRDPITKHLSLPISPIGGKAIPHQNTNSSLLAKVYSPAIRFRHIPRALSDVNLVFYPIAFCIIYVLILAVSFAPSISILRGFRPLVPGNATSGGFSPANFLYSFLPSLLGMFLYIGLLSLASQIAILTPWAEMNTTAGDSSGATPERSILVDYAYSINVPFATLRPSIRNKHYLVALLSIMTPITLLIPILAGGTLWPLTAQPSNTLLVFPQLGSYYTILVLLGLLLVTLAIIPILALRRKSRLSYRLPHGVGCLAEVLSFLYASQLLEDATFKNVRGQSDLRTRLLTSSGTMSDGDKRLTGDGRQSHLSARTERTERTRRDGRGVWDPEKWGGVGGWTRDPAPQRPSISHSRYNSYQSHQSDKQYRQSYETRYTANADDWSGWDKEMGLSSLGGVMKTRAMGTAVLAGRGLADRPGGGRESKRYFLGIFRGRDGRSHLGIERVGRGSTRDGEDFGMAGPGVDQLGRSNVGGGRSQSRFSL